VILFPTLNIIFQSDEHEQAWLVSLASASDLARTEGALAHPPTAALPDRPQRDQSRRSPRWSYDNIAVQEDRMDTIPTLHHVTLKTTRLKEMIDWYGLVVGLKPQYVAPVGAWLTNDAANHRLALLAFPGISDDVDKDSHTGIHHMAFEFSSLDELFGNFAWLRTLEITPSLCLDHGTTISMYYADPDRNVVELQVDNFHDWTTSSEYMRTGREFAANPLGVLFDPGRAYDAFKAGKTHEELHRAMMSGHLMPDAPPPLIGLPHGASLGPPSS
jgi:catechol 2,3-dioxygenase